MSTPPRSRFAGFQSGGIEETFKLGQPAHAIQDNVGTAAIKFVPYEERDHGCKEVYQAISLQAEYRNFSLEELRLADYTYGRGGSRAESVKKTFSMSEFVQLHKDLIPDTRRSNGHLELLRGPGFEVCVGESDSPNADRDVYDTWCLPQALISHYSPFLKAACSRNFKEKQEKRIELPEQDPRIFGKFVDWMYYGDYEVKLPLLELRADEDISVDAQCWVLGDYLQCPKFKNHAMARLYAQHTPALAPRLVTTSDVRFACDNTPPNSKLRQFYFHFVATHLSMSLFLKGARGEWDKLLLSHTDAMAILLQWFRVAPHPPALVKDVHEYLDRDESLSKELSELKLKGTES